MKKLSCWAFVALRWITISPRESTDRPGFAALTSHQHDLLQLVVLYLQGPSLHVVQDVPISKPYNMAELEQLVAAKVGAHGGPVKGGQGCERAGIAQLSRGQRASGRVYGLD